MDIEINCTVADIAGLVGGEVIGDPAAPVRSIASIEQAGPQDLTFLSNKKYEPFLKTCQAAAVVVGPDQTEAAVTLIRVQNSDLAFATVMKRLAPAMTTLSAGISEHAYVAPDAKIGEEASIGPHAVVEAGSVLGDRCLIYPGAYVGPGAKLGDDCILHANATVGARVILGHRVIVHSGAVIGSDGFGYAFEAGVYHKIPQLGTVQLDDDVEVGANSTIDRARFDKTHIKTGTKIDNLVQIGHNAVIGEHCCLVALTGIAGSTTVGHHSVFAAQSGALGHLDIGEQTVVAARGGVIKDVASGTTMAGFPAQPLEDYKQAKVLVRRLPKLHQKIRDLEARIEQLESRSGRNTKTDEPADDQ